MSTTTIRTYMSNHWRRTLSILALGAILTTALVAGNSQATPTPDELEDMLYLKLKDGWVTIRLYPDKAPKHVQRIKKLTRMKFYDGLKFHRVIAGFMAQTGDPTGTGASGSHLPDLRAEFNDTPFNRGTLGAARTSDPDSANSQFFICFKPSPWLNGQYTVFGQVIKGMNAVDAIKKGHPRSGTVINPDIIQAMVVAADCTDKALVKKKKLVCPPPGS